MNLVIDDSTKKSSVTDTRRGIKLGIGISIVALILLATGALIGIVLFRQFAKTTDSTSQSQNTPSTQQKKPSEEDLATKFMLLSSEEKLRKRLAGVEGGNKGATNGCVLVLSGPNQDVITVTAPLRSYSNESAAAFAKSFMESFLTDEQTVKEMVALEFTTVIVTDGKRSWTRDLKTGALTQKVIE